MGKVKGTTNNERIALTMVKKGTTDIDINDVKEVAVKCLNQKGSITGGEYNFSKHSSEYKKSINTFKKKASQNKEYKQHLKKWGKKFEKNPTMLKLFEQPQLLLDFYEGKKSIKEIMEILK